MWQTDKKTYRQIPLLSEKQICLFQNKIDAQDCWVWLGAKDRGGYGLFNLNGATFYAHRISYALNNPELPNKLQLDHLCRNRGCVNPSHLEPVTQQENITRGQTGIHQRNQTHCKNGHEFTPENTYMMPTKECKSGFARNCRTCRREATRRYLTKKRGHFVAK